MTKICGSLIAVCTFIGIIFGYYFWMDNRYAQAQHLKEVEQRLDYKIKSDQTKSIQTRIWQLQDRCHKSCTAADQQELRELQFDLDNNRSQLKSMEKK
jgi:Flp pilus assembly protein TadB